MTHPVLTRERRWRLIWPLILATAIFLASEQDKVADPGGIPHSDKLGHFAIFGLLGILVVRAVFDERSRGRRALLAVAIVSIYGLLDETHQSFTPGRSVEVADWIADTAGASVAIAVYTFWPAYRFAMELPLRRRRGTGRASSSQSLPLTTAAPTPATPFRK